MRHEIDARVAHGGRGDEVVQRTRARHVRAVGAPRVVAVEGEDVIVAAPHFVAEAKRSRNR